MPSENEFSIVHTVRLDTSAPVNSESCVSNPSSRAQLEHDKLDAELLASGRLTGDLGIQAIKAPGFAAAASAVALLGYVSANFDTVAPQMPAIMSIMISLMLAIGLSTIAHGGAYVSQFLFFESLSRQTKSFEPPYRGVPGPAKWLSRIGHLFHAVTIGVVIGSYICLVAAGVSFLRFFSDAG